MFEKALPLSRPQTSGADHAELTDDMLVGTHDRAQVRGGNALRAIDWNELASRLNAARDLRRVLKRDAMNPIEPFAASFGDAAAFYFQMDDAEELPVNPVALEAPKASRAIADLAQEGVEQGDAREK